MYKLECNWYSLIKRSCFGAIWSVWVIMARSRVHTNIVCDTWGPFNGRWWDSSSIHSGRWRRLQPLVFNGILSNHGFKFFIQIQRSWTRSLHRYFLVDQISNQNQGRPEITLILILYDFLQRNLDRQPKQ